MGGKRRKLIGISIFNDEKNKVINTHTQTNKKNLNKHAETDKLKVISGYNINEQNTEKKIDLKFKNNNNNNNEDDDVNLFCKNYQAVFFFFI